MQKQNTYSNHRFVLIKRAHLFLTVERNEIRIKELKEDRLPVLTKESGFFRLMGSFSGPEDLAEKHDEYLIDRHFRQYGFQTLTAE